MLSRYGRCEDIFPSTINHQPSTINHQPSTTNHQPSTINHQPSTINHQPSTINHQQSSKFDSHFSSDVKVCDVLSRQSKSSSLKVLVLAKQLSMKRMKCQ